MNSKKWIDILTVLVQMLTVYDSIKPKKEGVNVNATTPNQPTEGQKTI